jgi:hypothetical protein
MFNESHDRVMGGNFIGGYLWAQKLLKLDPQIPIMKTDLHASPKGVAGFKGELDQWMKRYKPDAILNGFPEGPAYLQELGYRIPQDVAVAGTSLNDVLVDAGINQQAKAIGQIAAEMLIKQIGLNERGEPADPCRVLVESRWQDGNSLPDRKFILLSSARTRSSGLTHYQTGYSDSKTPVAVQTASEIISAT